jgi:hypothetical protein
MQCLGTRISGCIIRIRRFITRRRRKVDLRMNWRMSARYATPSPNTKPNQTPLLTAFPYKQVQQGKNLIEAIAATPSIERLILSTLSDTRGVSKGRITHNLHFDAKWAAVEYLKSTYSDLWKKTSLLQLGIFATNWKAGGNRPRKMEDGTFKVSLPMSGDKKLPMIDPTTDTGMCDLSISKLIRIP